MLKVIRDLLLKIVGFMDDDYQYEKKVEKFYMN